MRPTSAARPEPFPALPQGTSAEGDQGQAPPENRTRRLRSPHQTLTGLWRNPDFVRLWASYAVSRLGSQVTLLAMPLTAVALGAGPKEMGWLAAAQTLPALLLGLFAGIWVDRLPRRPLLIAADLARAALLSCIPLAAVFGQLRLELLYAIAVLAGTLAVLAEIAHASYLPALVDREHLVEGNSKLAVTGQVASVAGPPFAGALVQIVTAPLAVLADALTFVVSAIFLGTVRRPESTPTPSAERQPVWREIGEGLRFVAAHPALRTLTGAFGLYFFFDALFWGLYPLYVTRDLGVGAATLGLIFAFGSVGGVLGALLVQPITRRFGFGPTMCGALFVGALGELCIPLAGGTVLAASAVLALGEVLVRASDWVFAVNFVSLRQALTPDRLQGRVNATIRVCTTGAVPLGAFIGGALGESIGLRATVLVGASGVVLAFLWVALSPVRSLRTLPNEMSSDGETRSTRAAQSSSDQI